MFLCGECSYRAARVLIEFLTEVVRLVLSKLKGMIDGSKVS